LRKICVARAPDQQAVRLLAVLFSVRSEPRALPLAGTKRAALNSERVVKRPGPEPAFATDHGFGYVAGCPPFFDHHPTAAAWAFAMDENAPVDVVQVAGRAATYKAHRNNLLRPRLILIIGKAAGAVEIAPADEAPPPPLSSWPGRL